MKPIRAAIRLLIFGLGLGFYLLRYFIKVPISGMDLSRGVRLRQEFVRLLIPIMGVEVIESGSPSEISGMFVSNHRSYFDPVVVLAKIKACPVAKAEVKKWPLIGLGLQASGVFFVDRRSQESRRKTRQEVIKLFKNRFGILIYPEGTTHIRKYCQEFHMGVFKEAAEIGAPVYPIAIEYPRVADAWVGDDTFLRHFFERFGQSRTQVKIAYGPELTSANAVELKENASKWINQQLEEMQKGWSEFEMMS